MLPRRFGLRPTGMACWRSANLYTSAGITSQLRQTRTPSGRWTSKAWESTAATTDESKTTTGSGHEKSGHISAANNEAILWFDNLFPLKLTTIFRFPWHRTDHDVEEILKKFDNSSMGITDPINMVKRAIPDTLGIKVTEILPRLKDGGAFVKFSHPDDVSASEIEKRLSKLLQNKPIRPWFNPFRSIKTGLVRGIPWLEDLYRFPKGRIKVEFVPGKAGEAAYELSQETLYSLFRRYGKIAEITSQASDSKVLPKFAHVDFALLRDSIMARNCMHGFVVLEELGGGTTGTRLQLSYEQRAKAHNWWNWITNHPRIAIPIFAALLAAFTVVIFDPIREFFVKAHVQHTFRLSNNRLYRWVRAQTTDLFESFRHDMGDQAGFNAIWTHRKDLIDKIQTWLMETSETFIIVQGPRGSGKKELVMDQALKGRKNVILIDCKPIADARGESATIKKMAQQVGYRPVFSYANNLSSMIDLAVQSTTGVKAGFSETLDSQLQKILQTTGSALTEIDVAERKKSDPDGSVPADVYLESHPEKRAVVVFENFLHKGEENSMIYEKLAEWAATLVQSNVAHVVFLTNDTSPNKYLSKSLPDRVFRTVALGDLSPDVAKRFVISRLEDDINATAPGAKDEEQRIKRHRKVDLEGLDDCIGSLGGRLTDLEFLARRLQTGQSPRKAVIEITEQSASEILKMFLLTDGSSTTESDGKKWSVEQAWWLIKELAAKESLRYNEVLLSDTFCSSLTASNPEAALDGLANSDLVSVTTLRGRPQEIRVGKPVYQSAFRLLTEDVVLNAKMDMAVLKELTKIEGKNIDKYENELNILGTLPTQPKQVGGRIQYLLTKLEASQAKVERYEKEIGALKKVMASES